MSLIDAQGHVFTFNGAVVGKIVSFNTVDGITQDVKHSPIGQKEHSYFPGVAEFGNVNFKLYRDYSDLGQIEMENARAISLKCLCSWQLPNGVTISFTGYVKKLPIVGSDDGLGTADAVIKIASKVTLVTT